MAKYDVTYKCGHAGQVDLWGKGSERARKLSWLAGALCPECYEAEQAAEVARLNDGLATLTGSDKQVAWALKIRGEWIKSVDHRLADIAKVHGAGRAAARRAEIAGLANSVTGARWWIDNRDNLDGAIVAVRKARQNA